MLLKLKNKTELTEEEKAQLRLEKSAAVFIGAHLGFFVGVAINYCCSSAVASVVNPFIFIGACTIAGAGLMLLVLHLTHTAIDENSETIGYRI